MSNTDNIPSAVAHRIRSSITISPDDANASGPWTVWVGGVPIKHTDVREEAIRVRETITHFSLSILCMVDSAPYGEETSNPPVPHLIIHPPPTELEELKRFRLLRVSGTAGKGVTVSTRVTVKRNDDVLYDMHPVRVDVEDDGQILLRF